MTPTQLLESNLDLADKAARSQVGKTPHWADFDTLRSAALVALWKASEAFDPTRGVPFKAYAYQRMHGAMIDEVRRLDPNARASTEEAREQRAQFFGLDSATHLAAPGVPGDDTHLATLDALEALSTLRERDRLLHVARVSKSKISGGSTASRSRTPSGFDRPTGSSRRSGATTWSPSAACSRPRP